LAFIAKRQTEQLPVFKVQPCAAFDSEGILKKEENPDSQQGLFRTEAVPKLQFLEQLP
jgi:hypothetical protein